MCLLCYLENEDKLVADFAEFYHCFDWKSIPLETAAVLASELRPDSRSYMAAHGVCVSTTDALLAKIFDELQFLVYQHAGRGAQKPTLISNDLILGKQEKKHKAKSFDNSNDFEAAWRNLNG
ncbi:MAG: hypothetical protein PUE58_01940 [Lachnospiraceae bacterium]|nr:hypothetical protein [Lachnospiraceae bacterium]